MDGVSSVEPFDPPLICALCHRIISSENDPIDLESITICGDCKFLFLEDNGTPTRDIQRRTPRVRRTRYTNSSESIETMFSNMINLARHNQPVVPDLGNQSVGSVQRSSSHTTPSGSRRWRRGVSDTESDGFDSVYGESDVISYGGDSDGSVDVHSFLGDSDTDIDPMNAGLNQWSSDDDDDEWEQIETGENTLGSLIARVHLQRSLASNGRSPPVNWLNAENPFGNSDYLDSRSFEELLERLAETDNSRRGAPPAAASFVDNLERVVVNEEDHNGLACAICKDLLSVGTTVNRLPCLHLYHPSCIKPWLSSRNTCPLCRYELPTDDVDYENRKQTMVQEMQHQDEDAFFEEHEALETINGDDSGRGRGRWLLVAAPVVSLVGIALALWLGSSGPIRGTGSGFGSCTTSQRGNRSRRWWSLF